MKLSKPLEIILILTLLSFICISILELMNSMATVVEAMNKEEEINNEEEEKELIIEESITTEEPTGEIKSNDNNLIVTIEEREHPEKIKWYVGYTNDETNILSTEFEILDQVIFNTRIKYRPYNDEYYIVMYNDNECYIKKDYVSDKKYNYKSVYIKSHGFKCYTRYWAITTVTSLQYKLQHEYAYTGTYGIRMVNGRFCIAVGTAVTKNMGQYIDVILENGTLIPCIVTDQKADKDTAADRITTAHNKCVCEFYLGYVLPEIEYCGDVSKACPEWESPVCEFRVYDVNVFNRTDK